jgi:hypothetical protein
LVSVIGIYGTLKKIFTELLKFFCGHIVDGFKVLCYKLQVSAKASKAMDGFASVGLISEGFQLLSFQPEFAFLSRADWVYLLQLICNKQALTFQFVVQGCVR